MPQGDQGLGQPTPLGGVSSDDIPDVTVVANKVFGLFNPGWDEVGLEFLQGIQSTDNRYFDHIRPFHASNAPYQPRTPKGRFFAPILSLSTAKDHFDAQLDLLFNSYTPIPSGTDAGIALEFVLPAPVGLDFSGTPTNSWTVIIPPSEAGSIRFGRRTPGHPVPDY